MSSSRMYLTPSARLERALKMNLSIYNTVSNLRHCRENKRIRHRCERVHAIDSLKDFPVFAEAVRTFKEESTRAGDTLMWHGNANESLFYGHLKALSEYAGRPYNERDRFLLPAIEHGVAFGTDDNPSLNYPYVHNVVCQGAYRKVRSLETHPHVPIFTVGPYVHYARACYEDSAIDEMRKEAGRTLLVFPAHTFEGSHVDYQKDVFVDDVMIRASTHFDTVLVSAYWHDADDYLFTRFADKGARVVSAGLRSDPSFISRLKTMIALSDMVVGNSLGTNIGYSLYLGKPFVMVDADMTSTDARGDGARNDLFGRAKRLFANAFSAEPDSLQCSQKRELYERYWGGEAVTRPHEDIRALFEIGSDVLQASHGMTSRFARAVDDALRCYERSSARMDERKARLLTEALGVERRA